jgi:hypothetical protein
MLSGRRLRADFMEANLDAGFALLHLAATPSVFNASRALREAENALLEGRRRLSGLNDGERGRFRARLAELRGAIDEAKATRGTPDARPKVIRMPRR